MVTPLLDAHCFLWDSVVAVNNGGDDGDDFELVEHSVSVCIQGAVMLSRRHNRRGEKNQRTKRLQETAGDGGEGSGHRFESHFRTGEFSGVCERMLRN